MPLPAHQGPRHELDHSQPSWYWNGIGQFEPAPARLNPGRPERALAWLQDISGMATEPSAATCECRCVLVQGRPAHCPEVVIPLGRKVAACFSLCRPLSGRMKFSSLWAISAIIFMASTPDD